MGAIDCEECGRRFGFDVMPRRGPICFRCHTKSVNLGYTYGKEEFHGPTITERQRQQEAQAEAAGIKAEPVGERWV